MDLIHYLTRELNYGTTFRCMLNLPKPCLSSNIGYMHGKARFVHVARVSYVILIWCKLVCYCNIKYVTPTNVCGILYFDYYIVCFICFMWLLNNVLFFNTKCWWWISVNSHTSSHNICCFCSSHSFHSFLIDHLSHNSLPG